MIKLKRSNKLKMQKKRLKKENLTKFSEIRKGVFALKTCEAVVVTQKQLEAGRRTLTKRTKKQAKLWVPVKLNSVVTAKPLGVRMGKGKGAPSQRIKKASVNVILYELGIMKYLWVKKSFKRVSKKLPCITKIIWKGR